MNGHLTRSAIGNILAFPAGGRRGVERVNPALFNDNRKPQAPIIWDAWYHDAEISDDDGKKDV